MNIFKASWIIGLALAAFLYFTMFNDLSETELVRWSYLWIPLIIFGVVGNIALKRRAVSQPLEDPFRYALMSALKWTLIGFVLIAGFFETIWHDL